jgi:hypothetical protein
MMIDILILTMIGLILLTCTYMLGVCSGMSRCNKSIDRMIKGSVDSNKKSATLSRWGIKES